MAWEVIWEPRGVWRVFSGTLELGDLLSSVDVVQKDGRYDSLRYSINDFLAVEQFNDPDGITRGVDQVLGQAIGGSFSNSKLVMAIVATKPQIVAVAQIFLGGVPYPVRLFSTVEEARVWVEDMASAPLSS
ncbi:MAG: hypothetical protein ACKO4A_09350 [Gammaproteobacteria bacterium]